MYVCIKSLNLHEFIMTLTVSSDQMIRRFKGAFISVGIDLNQYGT